MPTSAAVTDPRLANLAPKDRLRFWAELGAKEAMARGELARHRAGMEAIALQIGAELLDVAHDKFCWTGGPIEVLMADRPEFEDEDLVDDDEDSLWPVNVEKALLARMRGANFDLEDALSEHAEARHDRSDVLIATVGAVARTEWFAVFTAADPQLDIEATYVFALNRDA